MKNVKCIGLFVAGLMLVSCNQEKERLLTLKLKNGLAIERNAQSVEITQKEVEDLTDETFSIQEASGKEIPYQWLTNGNLLLQTDFKPEEVKEIIFGKEAPDSIEAATYGRFVPERYDDFAWENDKIAYRMYGKTLEEVPNQNAWGMDVWTKNTTDLIIDKWYEEDDYHRDHGEGLDFFDVGSSLGAGDVLPYLDDQLIYLGNYTDYEIIDEGPLRFTFELVYPEVEKEDYKIETTKRISLDKGQQLNRFEVTYQFESEKDSLPVFAGIVHWDDDGKKTVQQKEGFATYWPEDSENGVVGTAIVLPDNKAEIVDVDKHLGVRKTLKEKDQFHFYVGGAWSKAGDISSAEEWGNYIKYFSQKDRHPIQVEKQ